MRLLGLFGGAAAVLGAAALAGCTEAGAHLTMSAPAGPGSVTSFQVVLANPEQVPTVANQRTAPSSLETESVAYYLQRTVAGGTQGAVDHVDGFAIRVEPDPAMTETDFIPFVLLYGGDKLVGVATFHAKDSAMPSPIRVVGDEIDKYVLDVEPVAQVADTDPVDAAQVRTVACYRDDQTMFTSGIVWRPKTGGEIRLLLPDDGGLDATHRELDLDCDGHVVTPQSSGPDCDDSRDWFNRDARETCDGYDTNCDGLQSLVVACTGSNVCPDASTNMGMALCDDRTGTVGVCQSDPQCLCANGATTCPRCVVTIEAGTTTASVKPCQPGIGFVKLEGLCGDALRCPRVEVLQVGGGWKADISPDVTPYSFGSVAQNVGSKVILRVKRPEGPGTEIPGVRGASTGDVTLGVQSPDGSMHLRTLDLQLDVDAGTCTGSGPYQMVCFP
jgi:hypothetical protein